MEQGLRFTNNKGESIAWSDIPAWASPSETAIRVAALVESFAYALPAEGSKACKDAADHLRRFAEERNRA